MQQKKEQTGASFFFENFTNFLNVKSYTAKVQHSVIENHTDASYFLAIFTVNLKEFISV